MELVWEDPPVPDGPFFTRDLYLKYTLAPNVKELWALLNSPPDESETKQGSDVEAAAKVESNSDGEDPCTEEEEEEEEEESNKGARKPKAKKPRVQNEVIPVIPNPRLPYPCLSALTAAEQNKYLGFLMSNQRKDPPPAKVNNEVMHFLRYLQDVARLCADDYNYISQGAMQYTEDFFSSCQECIKSFPQFYQISEMTSLTGGTFNPALTLTFEKQLLIMGSVDITDHRIVAADAQLASDCASVSSEHPPAKKAKDMHATISGDANAEKLCGRYEPHVCLTRDALVKLLDNHGPEFAEQWELPVWIKSNSLKGSSQKTTVYIDSPLLKTEVTVRERSLFFHEESLKLSVLRNGTRDPFHIMTQHPASEQQQHTLEQSQRSLLPLEDEGLFEVDLTDLETFGETMSSKTTKKRKLQDDQPATVKSKKATTPVISDKITADPANTSSSSQEEMNSSLTDVEDPVAKETPPSEPSASRDSSQESEAAVAGDSDDDEEKLVIDDSITPSTAPKTVPQNMPESPSPQRATRRPGRKAKAGDQLGEILRMQTRMFSKCPSAAAEAGSPGKAAAAPLPPPPQPAPPPHPTPTSLVKPCVTSYLERNQDGESSPHLHKPAPVVNTEQKKILSQDLQASAEDAQDYEAPEEGNLIYKLYSLQELLLLVRSSVALTHTRHVGNNQNQFVPVHVLPKLEYQLSYGAECLTRSESCQIWTETLLHSTTVSYIAHINAYSSKVALLRKLPDDWKHNVSCGFTPSKSLNILHHLLKKLTRLAEGQYLIVHKPGEPFVTLMKAATGRATRGAYDLQQVHGAVPPQPPAAGPAPWIPVDPAVVLPFHQAHGRVPCTFPPPHLPMQAARDGSSQANNCGRGQRQNQNMGGGAKKKKKKKPKQQQQQQQQQQHQLPQQQQPKQTKRTARRDKYIKKLLQKSV